MAGSESNTDESLLLPELVTSSECEEFLRTIGAFCDVPDTVKEECFADQSCLQNTQAAIHNQQLQDTLVSEGYCTPELAAQHIQYNGLSFMSPPGLKATSDMPSTDEYSGPHSFEIQVDSSFVGRNVMYSSSLNKLFITVNRVMYMGFKNSSVATDVYVRALLIYSEAQHFKEPVVRCVFHKYPDHELNKGVNEMLIDYVLHTDHSKAVYEKDSTSGRHSVRVSLDRPQAGAEWVTVPYKFMCKSSCDGGMNRRLTEVIFTLENESGEVLGRRKMKVRICSCPKRDKDKEEADAAKNQNQTLSGGKRKLASTLERQNKQVAKRKFEGFPQQIFLTKEEFLDATVVAEARLKRKLCAENREPTEEEEMLLRKYDHDLARRN